MKKELTSKEVMKKVTQLLSFLNTIRILILGMIISAPFVWIWVGWSLAWRVGLSGFIALAIIQFILKIANKTAVDSVRMIQEIEAMKSIELIESLGKQHKNTNDD